MGIDLDLDLIKDGFFPNGGGEVVLKFLPVLIPLSFHLYSNMNILERRLY